MKSKLFSLAMAALILATACSKQLAPEPLPSFQEELSSFLSTKASEPMEETLWKHVTGETFDRYILFKDGEIRLFYGTMDELTAMYPDKDFEQIFLEMTGESV